MVPSVKKISLDQRVTPTANACRVTADRDVTLVSVVLVLLAG